jgi:hypothetical protein
MHTSLTTGPSLQKLRRRQPAITGLEGQFPNALPPSPVLTHDAARPVLGQLAGIASIWPVFDRAYRTTTMRSNEPSAD